ncbi:BTB/POZ domain-containing protein [Phlyctema vagabunda]|uniref:BTB/POZ domain-containing protein n=1 Tax=Phlyctema vagabunda TaxID=108571 RepID=A0ABR4PLF7_9HELO
MKDAEEAGDDHSNIRTLYIDRDPATFADISRHLQGYHITPRDGAHFVKLFADAQFYSLPRLISQLYEESIFISIGYRDFQIPRELFSDPGNSPNYFSLGFAVFFSTPTAVFPGLNRDGLLRPPSILPPSVPNRSAETFAEILHLLRGYPVHIRNEDHRAELIRDCKYFHLKGLEQKLIRHQISFNLARQKHEICLRLEDVRQSGVTIAPPTFPIPGSATPPFSGYINYARPFVDEKPYELVLEIGGECTKLHLHTMRAEFFGEGKKRISRLFEVVATKLNMGTSQPLGLLMKKGGASSQPASPGNTPLSEDHVRVYLESTAHVVLDGQPWKGSRKPTYISSGDDDSIRGSPPRKRMRDDDDVGETWIVRKGQWRLRVQHKSGGKGPVECVLVAVKLDAISGELARNADRGFLGS